MILSKPEEAGALDESYELAREVGAELIIANDPDVDRFSAAISDSALAADYSQLSGDEAGPLLGEDITSRQTGAPDGSVFTNSIVSSRGLAAAARAHDIRAFNPLTGFKWISRVPGLPFGFEDALSYCVDPTVVRDKDGNFSTAPPPELPPRGRLTHHRSDDPSVRESADHADRFICRRSPAIA